MRYNHSLWALLLCFCLTCSNSVTFSEAFIKDTTGNYLYNEDSMMQVFYEDQTLFLKWKGGLVKPVVLDENEFFVPDMYKKLKFVKHPENDRSYISIIPENEGAPMTYDYPKVPKTYKTPSMHLKAGNYAEALEGYLAIKQKDSATPLINEWDINNMGYKYLREKKYQDAIAVFELNVALHPTSFNVHDSLAAAYLKSGDSANAYINFKKVLLVNNGNKRAQNYIKAYESKDK